MTSGRPPRAAGAFPATFPIGRSERPSASVAPSHSALDRRLSDVSPRRAAPFTGVLSWAFRLVFSHPPFDQVYAAALSAVQPRRLERFFDDRRAATGCERLGSLSRSDRDARRYVRSASLTLLPSGNTLATSGSSSTSVVPAVARE
jgi:hypothetical protein